MKNQRNLSIILPLVVAIFTLVGCSDYDNGFTAKELHFTADFTREFGSFDPTQDWNLAERAYVTVTTSERKDVNVYTEKDGIYVQVGAFQNVSGTKKLEFDVIEDMQNLVVSDGDVALRAVIGGTVNFDEHTSVAGEVVTMATRGGEYVNRNMWMEGYVVPANITEAERAAVVAEFSKQHYGAYNTALIPWTEMFVQQVYKGEAEYYDAFNQQTGVASDKMNRLMVWDNAAPEEGKVYDNGYIHVNDFNNGNQTTVAYDDHDTEHQHPIIGLTLMRELDPTDCPVVTVTETAGYGLNWVQQFAYHNSQSNEYQPTYIMKKVTWEEDGIRKSGLYLGFDFYAQKRADQPADKNMDVERDWIFNDWIVKISMALDTEVPIENLQDAKPQTWILAGEDLGGGFDIDYNDVVVKVERMAGSPNAYVTPLAAGGTLASYLFFGNSCIGEIHQLLGASPSVSGKYGIVNMGSNVQLSSTKVEVNVGRDWTLADEDVDMEHNNMGGFTIRVLPAGTPGMSKMLNYDNPAFDEATDVKAPVKGQAPYILCVPFTYTLTNTPSEGLKTTNVWAWPKESATICDGDGNGPYPHFNEWARNKENNRDWYEHPDESYIVSTKQIARSYAGEQPASMSTPEVSVTSNPNYRTTFYNDIPSVYEELTAPTPTLSLKQEGDIYVHKDDIIDMLDYVNVSADYRDKVFCVSPSSGEMLPVEGSFTKLKCMQDDHRTLVYVKLATPGGVLSVQAYINSGSSTGSDKPNANIWYSEYDFSVTVGASKSVTVNGITGAVSVRSLDSNVATATLNGTTLTITGVSAGTTQIILTQAETDDYKETDAYYNVTVTAATPPSVDEDDGDDSESHVTPTGNTVLLDENKNTSYTISISERKSDGTNDIYYNEEKVKEGVTSITLNWTGNQASWGTIASIVFVSNKNSYNYTSDAVISGSYTITDLNKFDVNEGSRDIQIRSTAGVPFNLSIQ